MDAAGHVHDVVYLRYLEEARIDMFHTQKSADGGPAIGSSVVGQTEITYLRPLAYRPAPVRVDSRVLRIGAASCVIAHELVDGETVHARATSTLVAYDPDAGRTRRLSAHEREYLAKLQTVEEVA